MGLTKEQEQAVKEAIGDSSDWPNATTDPLVNHRVDQLVMNENYVPDWEQLKEAERKLYIEEAIIWSIDNV